MITLNDLVEPVTFPGGPISTPAERNLLLFQRAEGANTKFLIEKCQKRKRPNYNLKKVSISTSSTTTSKTNLKSSKNITNLRKRKVGSLDSSDDESSDELSYSSSEDNDNSQDDKNEEKESNSDDDASKSDDSEYEMDKFAYLRNRLHYDEDDKTIYKTTRVVEENGYTVVYWKKK